jgi:hypothetical protein
VNAVTTVSSTGYNADKSKIVAALFPGFNRAHFDAEGKIDKLYSYYDTSKVMPQMMSTADSA